MKEDDKRGAKNGTLASASLPRSGGSVEVGFRKKEKQQHGGEDVRGKVHSRDKGHKGRLPLGV
jgi:hypothetical protein